MSHKESVHQGSVENGIAEIHCSLEEKWDETVTIVMILTNMNGQQMRTRFAQSESPVEGLILVLMMTVVYTFVLLPLTTLKGIQHFGLLMWNLLHCWRKTKG